MKNKKIKPSGARLMLEIAMIAAIIADHYCEHLYKVQEEGYINTVDLIGQAACAFYKKHATTDWDEAQCNSAYAKKRGFSGELTSWDDAVIEYAYYWFEKKGYPMTQIKRGWITSKIQ